jgi:hypothetical protein
MANTFELISAVTVGSGGAANITFSSIPSTYTDLIVKMSTRADNNAGQPWSGLRMAINGNSSNMSFRVIYGDGVNASSGGGANAEPGIGNSNISTSDTFGNSEFCLANYAGSTNKSFSADSVQETNATTSLQGIEGNKWADTSAVTSITITNQNSWNFVQYSTAYLYGVKNA